MKVFSPDLEIAGVVEHGAGNGLEGRGLEEVAVEAAQDPVQAGNFNRCADAGIDCGLVRTRRGRWRSARRRAG